jgi:hypothetical protein
MSAPCIRPLILAAIGGLLLGIAIGLRKTGALQADVATWRTLAEELHSENSRLRLGVLSRPRRTP